MLILDRIIEETWSGSTSENSRPKRRSNCCPANPGHRTLSRPPFCFAVFVQAPRIFILPKIRPSFGPSFWVGLEAVGLEAQRSIQLEFPAGFLNFFTKNYVTRACFAIDSYGHRWKNRKLGTVWLSLEAKDTTLENIFGLCNFVTI